MPHRRRTGQWALLAVSLGLGSCRDEVVQTAKRSPETQDPDGGTAAPLDCQGSEGSNELPLGTQFGEGDTLDSWPLVAEGYGPREGPGLYVLARDTFRAYVNGHLVAESESPRTPVFVPVSLQPGENVIAITVSAGSGTPTALVQFDDLTRSYVSGIDWKLSTAPEGGWTAIGYDDGSWDSARELAAAGALTGCEAAAFFPENTTAAWIGPALGSGGPVALRVSVRIEPVGFAEGTIGGAEAAPELVSTWEDLEVLASSDTPATILLAEGVHDLRLEGAELESIDVCRITCPENPARTFYDASNAACAGGTEAVQTDARVLQLGSNKTLLGLGRGAAVRGVGFDVGASENIIVRNLAVYDINRSLLEAGDAFTLQGARRFWLDHVTIKWVSDAFADILDGAADVTLSHVLFDGGTAGECNGQEHWAVTLEDTRATIHHTRFDQVSGYAPYADGPMARVHLFNNVYSNSADWTLGSACAAQVLVEGSVFENVEAVARIVTCSDLGERGLINVVSGSNLFQDGSAQYIGGDGEEPHDTVFVPEYEYDLEPASQSWPLVISRAGAGGPWALPVTLDP
jgi:pectate lyase